MEREPLPCRKFNSASGTGAGGSRELFKVRPLPMRRARRNDVQPFPQHTQLPYYQQLAVPQMFPGSGTKGVSVRARGKRAKGRKNPYPGGSNNGRGAVGDSLKPYTHSDTNSKMQFTPLQNNNCELVSAAQDALTRRAGGPHRHQVQPLRVPLMRYQIELLQSQLPFSVFLPQSQLWSQLSPAPTMAGDGSALADALLPLIIRRAPIQSAASRQKGGRNRKSREKKPEDPEVAELPRTGMLLPMFKDPPAFLPVERTKEPIGDETSTNLIQDLHRREANLLASNIPRRIVYDIYETSPYVPSDEYEDFLAYNCDPAPVDASYESYAAICSGKGAPTRYFAGKARYLSTICPYYHPLDETDTTLVFESRFESGNLRRAVQM